MDKIALSGSNYLQCVDNKLFSGHNNSSHHDLVENFEGISKKYFGDKRYTNALNSGTSAIHLALILLGVGKGDEVICQSATYVASANPINYLGATPIFIDSESETGNISPNFLEEAIVERIKLGKKPKAIIAVHLYGMPYKVKEIHAISEKYEIPIIEDAAEALGSTYNGTLCGTFGDFGVISFNLNKIITTGNGGLLLNKSKIIQKKVNYIARQATERLPYFEHKEIGYNYRMSPVSAAIGVKQFELLPSNIKMRSDMHLFYTKLFKDHENLYVVTNPSKLFKSNNWLSRIIVERKSKRISTAKMREQFLDKNIETRHFWKPMHLQPIFKDAPYYGDNVSESLFKTGLCLPSGSNLTLEDKDRIRAVIAKFE